MRIIKKRGKSTEMRIADYLSRVEEMGTNEHDTIKVIGTVTGDKCDEQIQMLVEKAENK